MAGEEHSPRAGEEASRHQGGAASGRPREAQLIGRSSSHRADEENMETS